jgi:hypothetical protein
MYTLHFEINKAEMVSIPSHVSDPRGSTIPGSSKRLCRITVEAQNPAALSNVVSQLHGVVAAATAEDW